MPFALIVATLRLILHHLHLFPKSGLNNSALDLCTFNDRRTDGRVRAVVYEEHLVKYNRVTFFQVPRELLYSNSVALRDDILLPAGLDYGHFHSPHNLARFYKKLGVSLGTSVSHYNAGYKELGKIDKDVYRIAESKIGIEPELLDKPTVSEE